MGIEDQIKVNQKVDESYNVKFLFNSFKEKLAFWRNRLWPSWNSSEERMDAYAPLKDGRLRTQTTLIAPEQANPSDSVAVVNDTATALNAASSDNDEWVEITPYSAAADAVFVIGNSGKTETYYARKVPTGENHTFPLLPNTRIYYGWWSIANAGSSVQALIHKTQQFEDV